jgi:hypothetical protein
MNKIFTLAVIVLLAASNLVLIGSVYAESIPKPAIPEFTLKYVEHPYDVPPTYGVDEYTGKTIVTSNGYHVANKSVEITIKNQPFSTIKLDETHYANFYYNISYKGYYGSEWAYFVPFNNTLGWFSKQSDSEYTVIAFKEIPSNGGSIDFKVQAQMGYYTEYHMPFDAYDFTGQLSGWSNIQTVIIPVSTTLSPPPTVQSSTSASTTTATPTATSNPTGTVQDLPLTWLLIVVVAVLGVVVALLVVVVGFMRRRMRVLECKLAP